MQQPEKEIRFPLVRFGELEPTPPKWIVKGFLEQDCLALVFGDPGCGKSFLGIDVAACVATGREWHGRKVKQGSVIYLAGEGHNGLARRRMAWEIRHQRKLSDAPFFVSLTAASLVNPISTAQVIGAINNCCETPPGLVVIDTLARNFGEGDENSTQDMNSFITAADLIRSRYQCTVLLIHHTGHGDKQRARGAMALKGALDAEYRMDKDESATVRLENLKMKDGPEPAPMAFHIREVELGIEDEDGEPVTSAVLDSTEYEPPTKTGREGKGKWQRPALEALQRLYSERQRNLSDTGHDPATARVTLNEWRQACNDAGIPRNRWHDLRRNLPAQDLVRIDNGFIWPL